MPSEEYSQQPYPIRIKYLPEDGALPTAHIPPVGVPRSIAPEDATPLVLAEARVHVALIPQPRPLKDVTRLIGKNQCLAKSHRLREPGTEARPYGNLMRSSPERPSASRHSGAPSL